MLLVAGLGPTIRWSHIHHGGQLSEYIDQGAVKIVEIMGVSTESFEDAVQNAVSKTAESVKGITGVEIVAQTARVTDGRVTQYHATCKIAFAVR